MRTTSGQGIRAGRVAALHGGPVGDAASDEAIARLRQDLASLRATEAGLPHLKKGLAAAHANQWGQVVEHCRRGLALDDASPYGWHLLAIAEEKQGDWTASLDAYGKAFALQPTNIDIANDLGRLALRMSMFPQAEALFRHYLAHQLYAHEASANLASALRSQMRFEEAIEVVKPAIEAQPDQPLLWNSLGATLWEMGQADQAAIFFHEGLRLAPQDAKVRYNLANALYALGQPAEAIEHCTLARAQTQEPSDRAMMGLALAQMHLASGDLSQGWEVYEARLDPHYAEPIHFLASRPKWTPFADIAGRHLLLFAEQGLGDEILFSNTLEDVLAALGPGGRLSLAVDDRLVGLLRRSYPQINVGLHKTIKRHGRAIRAAPFVTDWADVDLWAPIGQMLRQFRPKLEDFPDRPQGYLKADPARVAYWRDQLAALPGPKVGLLWTSMLIDASRKKFFSPFEDWAPVLRTPGVSFVNLQYGDCTVDLDYARREFGVEIIQPADIDLKLELDDVAALSCALDLVIGPANASSNIAAACGAPLWLISPPGVWPRLGTDRYPWYPQARVFVPDRFADWGPLMADVAGALAAFVGDARGQARGSAA